jgi:hypothetical protein
MLTHILTSYRYRHTYTHIHIHTHRSPGFFYGLSSSNNNHIGKNLVVLIYFYSYLLRIFVHFFIFHLMASFHETTACIYICDKRLILKKDFFLFHVRPPLPQHRYLNKYTQTHTLLIPHSHILSLSRTHTLTHIIWTGWSHSYHPDGHVFPVRAPDDSRARCAAQ